MTDAIVCGAGAAGLAAAAALGRAGVSVVVLERGDAVGMSWRGRYDGLRLNTTGWMSSLPGYRARRGTYGEFPERDSWVRYLEDYAERTALDVRFGVHVKAVGRADKGWRVSTEDEVLHARYVVIATGYDSQPFLPDWPGSAGFCGELLHSSGYRTPTAYVDRTVLIIGPGTTGSEIASHIAHAGACHVYLSCRTPPNITSRKIFGVSVNVPGALLDHLPLAVGDTLGRATQRMLAGDLKRYGIGRSPDGVATSLYKRHVTPAYDSGFVDDIKSGRIDVVAAVSGFDRADVLLADGRRIRPDVAIAATGYRRGLAELVGALDVLDDDGVPLVSGRRQHPSAPGLFFNGFRATLSGQLRPMRIDARAIAGAVRRSMRT